MWDFTLVKFYCQTLFFFIFKGGWAHRPQALDIVKIIYLTQDMVETLHVVSITFYAKIKLF